MRNGFSTAIVAVSLALVSIAGWAASRAPAPAVPSFAIATTNPAPPSPSACIPAELGVAYLAGQPASGRDSGVIVVWDIAAVSCTLTGPIVLAGLDRTGRIMTTELSYQTMAGSTLTARGSRPRAGMQLAPGERAAQLVVSAGYSVDALHGYRPCARQTEPAIWQLTFTVGGALAIANADPRSSVRHGRGLPANHGLLTCRGVLDAPQPVRVMPSG